MARAPLSHHQPADTTTRYIPHLTLECTILRQSGLVMGGLVDTTHSWSINRPHHAWAYSCLVRRGRFQLTLATGSHTLSSDSPAWLVPRTRGFSLEAIGTGAHELLWWSLNPDLIPIPSEAAPWPSDHRPLTTALCALIEEGEDHQASARRLRSAWSDIAAITLARCLGQGPLSQEAHDGRPGHLLGEVAADLAYPWTLQELAANAGCSTGHLVRRFRAAGLDSPMQAVQRLRLSHAASLLLSHGHDLSAIAEMVGYTSPFSLSRAFKKTYGCSPDHYRRQQGP